MKTRREFIKLSAAVTLGSLYLPACNTVAASKLKNPGVQLYSVRKEMLADAIGTLKKISANWL